MNLSTPIVMSEWTEIKTGTGAISYSATGETATMSSSSTDKALLYLPYVAFPGDFFEFTCLARVESGVKGVLLAEYPNGIPLDKLVFDSEEWKSYTLRVAIDTVGSLSAGLAIGELAIGLGVDGVGEVEISRPQCKLIRGQGALRCVASAVISVDTSNIVSILDSFYSFGIGSLSFSAGNITVELSLPIDVRRGNYQINHKSMPNITTTADGWESAAGPIHFSPFSVSEVTSNFIVVGYDSSGLKVTDYTGKTNRFFRVDVFAQ